MNGYDVAAECFRENGHWGWDSERESHSMSQLNESLPMLAEMPVATDIDIDTIPESMQVATWMQIENQGQIGSCASHASTSCQELAYYRQTAGKTVQLNRMFAYLSAQKRDNISGDNGSTISGNADAAREWGTPLEELWPYSGRYPSGGWHAIPKACWDRAGEFKLRSWKQLRDYSEVLAWLVHGVGGSDIGIAWSVEPDSQGRVERYRQAGGGHSVALLDWNKRLLDSKGRPYIELFNSWGKNWGVSGRCWVHPEIVTEWCQRQTVVGFSDMLDIRPRPFDWITESFLA